MEFFGQQFVRTGEIEGLQLGFFFQLLRNGLVERALHVRRLDFIFDQRRVGGCGDEPIPGLRVEPAARLDFVCALKGGDRLFEIVSGLAVDHARRKVGAVEQHLSLYDRGHAGRACASLLSGGRRQLRRVDLLCVERRSLFGAALRGARRARHQSQRQSADENWDQEAAEACADRQRLAGLAGTLSRQGIRLILHGPDSGNEAIERAHSWLLSHKK